MDIEKLAERDLIGSLLLKPDSIAKIFDIVTAQDFSCDIARKAYATIIEMWRDKKPISVTSVGMGDKSLVLYLVNSTDEALPFAIHKQAMSIALKAKERRVNATLSSIAKSKKPVKDKLSETLELYKRELFIDKKEPEINSVIDRFEHSVSLNKSRKTLGISTGFPFLEEKLIQYIPGHMWIMGGFTSVGKTAMMIQKLCNLLYLDNSPSVVVISTEMTEDQLTSRIIANITGIYSQKILAGRLWESELESVERAKKMLRSKKLLIYDDVYELSEIEAVFRKAQLQGGVDIGFVDYVQNCRVRGAEGAYQAGEALSKGLQKLAKDVRCTLICLSQVSNDVGRGGTDQLEFKGAGEWAAVADVGIHLKKKGYNLKYLIKKNRHGPLHKHLFEYKLDYTKLEAIEEIR